MTTREQYQDAFAKEAGLAYPLIDELEAEFGFAVNRHRLEEAARVLACPVKTNPPNWQHGRVLYAVARRYAADRAGQPIVALDIGTAKGFSALCIRWALDDAGAKDAAVISTDVVDPAARVPRNTIAEVDGLGTLWEILQPWPETGRIEFQAHAGVDAIARLQHVDFAFVDGKHSREAVAREGKMLGERQASGDIVIFDDVHIPGVEQAVRSLEAEYRIRFVPVFPLRAYAIATRR